MIIATEFDALDKGFFLYQIEILYVASPPHKFRRLIIKYEKYGACVWCVLVCVCVVVVVCALVSCCCVCVCV